MIGGRRYARAGWRAAACAALLLGSCAFGDQTLRLSRDLAAVREKIGTSTYPVVVLAPFEDLRTDRSRCGVKKNGLGVELANLYCGEAPGTWLAELLAVELQRAGLEARVETEPRSGRGLQIEGALLRLFLEPYNSFSDPRLETDFQVRLTVRTVDGLFAERTFFAKGRNRGLGYARDLQSSFDDAVKRGMRSMVDAIVTLRDRYPGSAGVGAERADELAEAGPGAVPR